MPPFLNLLQSLLTRLRGQQLGLCVSPSPSSPLDAFLLTRDLTSMVTTQRLIFRVVSTSSTSITYACVIHPETITVLYRRQNRAALLLALVVAAVRMLGAIDATPLTSVMQTLMDRAVAIPGFRMRKTLGDSASMLMAVSVSILFLAVGGRRQAVKVVTSV